MALNIDQPPVNDRFVDTNGMLTQRWKDWFTTNIQSLSEYVSGFGIQLPPLTTAQINAIINPIPGLVVQNAETGEQQVYKNGTWRNILTT